VFEVGKYNITVNAVAPGFIKSEMSDSMPDEVIEAGIAMIPVKRIGTPEDMGYAYLFLASKEDARSKHFTSTNSIHCTDFFIFLLLFFWNEDFTLNCCSGLIGLVGLFVTCSNVLLLKQKRRLFN